MGRDTGGGGALETHWQAEDLSANSPGTVLAAGSVFGSYLEHSVPAVLGDSNSASVNSSKELHSSGPRFPYL